MADPEGAPLKSSAFADRIGQTFRAATADGTTVELTLTRCDETPYGDPAQWRDEVGRVPFSIEFRTESPHQAGQQIFTMSDDQLGELPVFVTPVGRDGDALRYEAVFS